MEIMDIAKIYQKVRKISELEQIKVGGWVKSVRKKKFINLNDGSCLSNLQVVCLSSLVD